MTTAIPGHVASPARVAGARPRIELEPGTPPRQGLAVAFARVIARAIAALRLADEHPVEAVHAFRTSVRRARAFLRVVRPGADEAWYRRLDGELRRALRNTSALRDAEVMLETLQRLPRAARQDGRELRRNLRAAASAARDAHEARRHLAEAAAMIAPLPDQFASGLPAELGWPEFEEGIAVTYRRSRRLRRRAAETRSHADIHAWRKRVKELRYALELVAGISPPARDELGRLEPLAESLGRITDLLLLRAYVLSGDVALSRESRVAVAQAIDDKVSEALDRQLRKSRRAFAPRPRRLARKVVRAAAVGGGAP